MEGKRVKLISTADPYTKLRYGAEGTVTSVDDWGTVHVDWDCGSSLGLIPREDCWQEIE
jgi:hypothetical protein